MFGSRSWLAALVLAGCTAAPIATAPTVRYGTATPFATVTPPPPTAPAVATTDPDPFAGWRLDDLATREYGGPGVVIGEQVEDGPGFTTHEMHYDSDGLRITGLVKLPKGAGPWPVVVVNHGYVYPPWYTPGDGSKRIADALHGYLVLMPDYRNHAGSDEGPNPFCIGYAIDVMNLIAQVESIPQADSTRIGVLGHSMGGGISHWPMLLQPEWVDAVVLYAAMHGDISQNSAHLCTGGDYVAAEEIAREFGLSYENPSGYAAASAVDYARVRMPVALHHGTLDAAVPLAWSTERYADLRAAGVQASLYTYEGAGHQLSGAGFDQFIVRVLAFFERHLG